MDRAAALALVSLVALCPTTGCRDRSASSPAAAAAAPRTTHARPALRLVVLVVIDQLPSWSFAEAEPALHGGLARLIAHGIYIPRAEVPFANTYTAPGHAALGTGAPPSVTGILANKWWRRELGAARDATDDPDFPVLAIPGLVPPPAPPDDQAHAHPAGEGQSSRSLLVPGIADVLRTSRTGSRSVALSLKDRSAILMLGERPDLAVWYDPRQAAMTTSRFYGEAPPAWLVAFDHAHPASALLATTWEAGDPALLAQLTGGPDLAPGEGEGEGLDTSFPHPLSESKHPAQALLYTPMATDLLFEAAEAALIGEDLGQDDEPDLLAISISSHDYAGHAWGQESWERTDLLLRADRRLGQFLDRLDHTVGVDRYAVLVTSDHGATPMVERSVAAGKAARRIPALEIESTAGRAARRILGDGDWVASYTGNTIYMSRDFAARTVADEGRALDAIVADLQKLAGMGFVARVDRLAGECESRTSLDERLACRAVSPTLSGEVFATPAPLSLVTTDAPDSGTAHGSPSDDDRFVPMILVAPGLQPRRVSESISLLRVAPTLARWLGVPPPAAATEPAIE